MKQEVIQDFLNLPGIAGVALMDRRSRPYFCGVDQALNFQQKEALAQGILQVLETIPDGFESFKFHFAAHQVYIHKLDHGIILLVLTRDNLIYADYLKTIKNLKAALGEDIGNAIAIFRLNAGNMTLSGVNTRSQRSSNGGTVSVSKAPYPNVTLTNPAPVPTSPEVPQVATQDPSFISLNDAIAALNHLSKFTTQYLGTHVIANYWKSTRPSNEWLNCIQVERTAQLSIIDATPQQLQSQLSPEQQACIREWVAEFVRRCSQVIRDFPSIIQQKALNDEQKSLLLG
ncbi:MAG: hypothetical protein IGS48_08760 [Oscillatoriales cyanobacterium C42_A2020_001]|nr:hypothetical protein [Leptolyngbyaceae cyanobacterium C42_A2020_001]